MELIEPVSHKGVILCLDAESEGILVRTARLGARGFRCLINN
jgi:hypothetical protein